eukprot:TRINITY_DN373_c0_g2_i1.p1 TRINITY_DN373_c0_g2~~TRINITY_DN373_c0_g2_i1.p1  ORF type:complete len:294 (+),score=47.03 TRINITY_DN373_c0_g2_i1:66-884(+)
MRDTTKCFERSNCSTKFLAVFSRDHTRVSPLCGLCIAGRTKITSCCCESRIARDSQITKNPREGGKTTTTVESGLPLFLSSWWVNFIRNSPTITPPLTCFCCCVGSFNLEVIKDAIEDTVRHSNTSWTLIGRCCLFNMDTSCSAETESPPTEKRSEEQDRPDFGRRFVKQAYTTFSISVISSKRIFFPSPYSALIPLLPHLRRIMTCSLVCITLRNMGFLSSPHLCKAVILECYKNHMCHYCMTSSKPSYTLNRRFFVVCAKKKKKKKSTLR